MRASIAPTARRLFPQGGDSLLAWLDDWADRRMLAALAERDLRALPVRRRIALLVRTRLELLTPHREAMRRAVAAHGLPGNLAGTGRALWRTVDLMWQAAGLGGDAERGLQLLLAARHAGRRAGRAPSSTGSTTSRDELRRELGLPRSPDRGRDAHRPVRSHRSEGWLGWLPGRPRRRSDRRRA